MATPVKFNRVERLLGEEAMGRISRARVIIFGVGGVGSWTAEALVRSGVGHLTIVDADCVAETNINRQLMATTSTVGQVKVDVLRRRLLDINPDAEIEAIERQFDDATAEDFGLETYDYVVDAIDSLRDKALLINMATRLKVKLFSSMGAALKFDPSRIRTGEFNSVKGCRLAAALRRKFKSKGVYPARKFQCVYSDELLPNLGHPSAEDMAKSYGKVAVNGALCHITAIFGFTLAGLVVRDVVNKS